MEHFWDLVFQLMKHGTNTLNVPFIFLLSIYSTTHYKTLYMQTEKMLHCFASNENYNVESNGLGQCGRNLALRKFTRQRCPFY